MPTALEDVRRRFAFLAASLILACCSPAAIADTTGCGGIGVGLQEWADGPGTLDQPDCTAFGNAAAEESARGWYFSSESTAGQEPGTVQTVFTHNIWGAFFILDSEERIIISDQSVDQILRFDPTTDELEVLAGNGLRGFGGDGGPAVDAMLAAPSGLAFGPDGNLFFADQLNHRVRVVDLESGIISTVVGVGPTNTLSGGFSGDGGPAIAAELSRSGGVEFDADWNLYLSDVANHRIRVVAATTGIIETFAGSGPVGFGNGTSTGDGGPATAATLDRPTRLAFTSAGDAIIVEAASERWRIVDAQTGIISAFAGTGVEGFSGDGGPATEAQFAAPTGIALDGEDNAFVGDQLNCRVRRIDASSGVVTTIGGDGVCMTSGDGGPAELASFDRPAILDFNAAGDLFIAGWVPAGHGIRVIAGAGVPFTTNAPPVALCHESLVEADSDCEAVASIDDGSFDPDGDPITVVQSPPGPYGLGTTEVTLTVTDSVGASDSCMAPVTVTDVTSPQLSVEVGPNSLWPPNHRLVDIEAVATATDNCGAPVIVVMSVTSSEADNGKGDGNTIHDVQEVDAGRPDFHFKLRAERSSGGPGRIYSAIYRATDDSGNETFAEDVVVVPRRIGSISGRFGFR